MSYDEADAWEEAEMEAMYEQVTSDPAVKQQFYEQLYDEIVKDFTDNRLRSFYEEQPDVAAPAIDALEEAKKFLPHQDTAAFIFGYIAAEVGLTSALLKPIVHGLVHSETAAALITKLAIKHSDENFTKILLDLLAAHGHVDPRTYKRGGSPQTLWEELKNVRTKRNRVFHQAERASHVDAALAINVAALVGDLFPTVVANLGLHFHGTRVCGTHHGSTFTASRPT
jgi:hypothetical protein